MLETVSGSGWKINNPTLIPPLYQRIHFVSSVKGLIFFPPRGDSTHSSAAVNCSSAACAVDGALLCGPRSCTNPGSIDMAATAFRGLMFNHTVLAHYCNPKPSFQSGLELRGFGAFKPALKWRLMLNDRHPCVRGLPLCHSSSTGRNHIQLKFDDAYPQDPTFVHYFKEAIRAVRLLFIFLLEQPGQLKYIEWPSFQSTLKTATLTLVLVALLIVILSSVDSLLSLLLALVLRRKA